jgi:hypothetical protein
MYRSREPATFLRGEGQPSPVGSETVVTCSPEKDGEGRNRTGDTTVFSRVLYQLSYLAARRCAFQNSLRPA